MKIVYDVYSGLLNSYVSLLNWMNVYSQLLSLPKSDIFSCWRAVQNRVIAQKRRPTQDQSLSPNSPAVRRFQALHWRPCQRDNQNNWPKNVRVVKASAIQQSWWHIPTNYLPDSLLWIKQWNELPSSRDEQHSGENNGQVAPWSLFRLFFLYWCTMHIFEILTLRKKYEKTVRIFEWGYMWRSCQKRPAIHMFDPVLQGHEAYHLSGVGKLVATCLGR